MLTNIIKRLKKLIEKRDIIFYKHHSKIIILFFIIISLILIFLIPSLKQPKEITKKDTKQIIKTNKKETIKPSKEIIKKEPLKNSIALILDDCGINEDNTKYVSENFPKEITLSFLPYAEKVQNQVDLSIKYGHEIMLHLPMEANSYNEPNINTLKTSWTDEQLIIQTNLFLNSFHGYKNINNHTGSKFTQDEYKMIVVLNELKKRNIGFLDSLTTSKSIAYKTAENIGIPSKKRDLFIDHEDNVDYIYNQLLKSEKFALKNGVAIVIGHPRDNTIKAIEKWLATKHEDIRLVKISEVYK